jgi:hypothetical protein
MKIKNLDIEEARSILQSFVFLEPYFPESIQHYRVKETGWVFFISGIKNKPWDLGNIDFCILDFSKASRPQVSFEEFFDAAPVEVQECLAFHLDLFRD